MAMSAHTPKADMCGALISRPLSAKSGHDRLDQYPVKVEPLALLHQRRIEDD